MRPEDALSRREREIMDIVHRLRRATAKEVLGEMGDPPSYSAVRATMRVLEEKGHLVHEREGARYVYRATRTPERARRTALERVLSVFFEGSAEKAVAALLDLRSSKLSRQDFDRLRALIDKADRGTRG
jgi:predicted transcriptional regulator